MSIVERVKNICLTPATEWPVIAAETATAGGLVGGYAAPLIAVGAVAGFIGGSIIPSSACWRFSAASTASTCSTLGSRRL